MKFYRCWQRLFLGFLGAALLLLYTGPGIAAASAGESPAAVDMNKLVDTMLANMSIEQKVGQMMMVGIHGPSLDKENQALLQQIQPGGVILYDDNMKSQAQVRQLNQQLQAKYGQKMPLFISVDEEGGLVSRMKNDLTPPPSQEAIGRTGKPERAREAAGQIARNLHALGFNVNFAPVADVGSGRERSFGRDPKRVADFVQQAAAGYEETNMIYTLKHFPGIGRGHTDSHLDTVVVDAPREVLQREDMLPFRQAMAQYRPENYFIMVSHISYPALDANNPASLSSIIVTDMLRRQLGWQGVIITDAMEMGALAKYYSFEEMGVKAVQAGEDLLLIAHGHEAAKQIYQGILKAVRNGEISQERLDASVKRILLVKLHHLFQA